MPETLWPTLPSTLWLHTDRMYSPSSSLAFCLQPALDSSHSSSLPFLNRSITCFSNNDYLTHMDNYSKWVLFPNIMFLIQFSLCLCCRSPSGQVPAPGWMTECFPCVSWSTSLWPTPCWWSTLLSTVLMISQMRWGNRILHASKKHLFIAFYPHCFGLCELSGSVEHQRADHPSAQAAAALCGEAQQGRRFPHGCRNSRMLSLLLSSIVVHVCVYVWNRLYFLL